MVTCQLQKKGKGILERSTVRQKARLERAHPTFRSNLFYRSRVFKSQNPEIIIKTKTKTRK
jgi:hypothetical protein